MKARQLVIIVCSMSLLISCSKINLQANKGQTGQANTTGQPSSNQSSVPPLDGEWEIDYEYKGSFYQGNAVISQQGNVLVGTGGDQDGNEWQLAAGQIQGTQISFQKKYADANRPAVNYTGEVKYLQTAEYTGWAMEGTYESQGANGAVKGKWVGNPLAPLQEPQAQQAPQAPFQINIPTASAPPQQASENLGDVKPLDISGHYDVSYQYNFRKIKSKMWLRNDGKNLSGDGVDYIDKTSERFTIPKGWYDFPKVTIIRQYKKGGGAKESRTITFKATLTSNGRDINMKGETQYGGGWTARLVR